MGNVWMIKVCQDLPFRPKPLQHFRAADSAIHKLYGHCQIELTIGPDGFFWPVFPLVGWGIGVVMNAWDVYRPEEFTEEQVRREVERLQRDLRA